MIFEIELGLNDEFRVVFGMGEFGDCYFGIDDEWVREWEKENIFENFWVESFGIFW